MLKNRKKHILLLHINILIYSATGIFSKLLANSINADGILHWHTVLFAGLMVLNCGIYALFWQKNLKRFDMNVAYAHKSVYNIWSLLWAVLIFAETITVGNVVGTVLIVIGVVVAQSE